MKSNFPAAIVFLMSSLNVNASVPPVVACVPSTAASGPMQVSIAPSADGSGLSGTITAGTTTQSFVVFRTATLDGANSYQGQGFVLNINPVGVGSLQSLFAGQTVNFAGLVCTYYLDLWGVPSATGTN
jgi:hypothetical protein